MSGLECIKYPTPSGKGCVGMGKNAYKWENLAIYSFTLYSLYCYMLVWVSSLLCIQMFLAAKFKIN